MKRILQIVLIVSLSVIPFLSLAINHADYMFEGRFKSAFALDQFGEIFSLPPETKLSYSESVLKSLEEVSLKNHINIFKTFQSETNQNVAVVDYFILLSYEDTAFYNFFPLSYGQNLKPEQTKDSQYFLSTVESDNPHQIGVITNFGAPDRIQIFPVSQISDLDTLSGNWTMECLEQVQCDNFRSDLVQEFKKYGYEEPIEFSQSSFFAGGQIFITDVYEQTKTPLNNLLIIILVAEGLLICFIQINENKRFAVFKLLGKNIWRIWFETTGKISLAITFTSSILAFVTAWFVPNTTSSFYWQFTLDLLTIDLVVLLISLVTIPYLYLVSLAQALKNRADTLWLVILSMAAKFGISLLLLFFGISATNLFFNSYTLKEGYDDWRETFDYGGFVTTDIGGEMFSKEWQTNELKLRSDLYPTLNQSGAIYIMADGYRQYNLDLEFMEGQYRSIRVNPNYLKTYPIWGNQGSVKIEETETDWVLLVPEQYQNQEQEILEYFQFFRTKVDPPITNPYIKTMTDIGNLKNNAERQLDTFGVDAPKRFYTQKVKIIWTQNDQKVFSADPEVLPEEQNFITDPIVEVMTLSNSLANDRMNAYGGPNSALKVKLVDRDPVKTYEALLPTLKSLGLDKYLSKMEVYSDAILPQITINEYTLSETLKTMIYIFLIFILSILPAVLVFFSYRARTIAVQKLMGFGLFRRHQNYFWLTLVNWLLVATVFVSGLPANQFDSELARINSPLSLLPILVFVVVDVIISFITFRLVERARVSNLLKGE